MEIFDYLQKTLHIDPIIVLIVLASGFFTKRYLKKFNLVKNDEKTNDAVKTLVISFIVSIIYLALQGLPREMWSQYFLSYFLATSLYELILRPIIKAVQKATGSLDADADKGDN